MADFLKYIARGLYDAWDGVEKMAAVTNSLVQVALKEQEYLQPNIYFKGESKPQADLTPGDWSFWIQHHHTK